MVEKWLKRQPPGRIIALGFALAIFVGSFLLMLPVSLRTGVSINYIDALYTSASAVCVTGLIAVDAGDTFTPFGQFMLGLLIQIGGLGVTSVGAGVILAIGQKINLKGRSLIRESLNLSTGQGLIRLLKNVLLTTFVFEFTGALLSFCVFVRDYPPLKAAGISLFHSVATFNNSGFDILGNFQSLMAYKDNLALNLITSTLIILGGIGFWVIHEIVACRFNWRRLSMHSKTVISMSTALITVGTLLLKATEDISWLGAFFQSVSARTAGFSTYAVGSFTNAGLLIMILLMFIGASPGSTGGGIKTTTFFVLVRGIRSSATNTSEKAFHYSLPTEAFRKASVITFIALAAVLGGTYLVSLLDPQLPFIDVLFEMVSAFGTVGLSTGITVKLSLGSKIISILMMYMGRLGPLTIASLWYFKKDERVSYPVGNIFIG
ncbi:MAG: TrkH family potassium uptake protein [Candidatus Bruticola sp.]